MVRYPHAHNNDHMHYRGVVAIRLHLSSLHSTTAVRIDAMTMTSQTSWRWTLAAMLGAVLMQGCQQEDATTPPAPAEADASASGDANIDFTSTVHNFGSIWDIESRDCVFEFTNSGDGELVIEKVKASCGCTAPTLPKTRFAPGETGRIDVTFRPKDAGQQRKSITVTTNAPHRRVLKLWIEADVANVVTAEPDRLQLGNMVIGETVTHEVRLIPASDDFVFTTASTRIPGISLSLGPAAEGDPDHARTLVVTCGPDLRWGQVIGSLEVNGSGSLSDGRRVQHTAKVTASGQAWGTIKATDSMFRLLTLQKNEPFTRALQLERVDGQPFQISNASISIPVMASVTATPLDGSNNAIWSVTITGNTGSHEGTLSGYVTLTTDVAGEKSLRLRAAGRVE